MKIVEVRDGYIKLESDKNVLLSSLILISDTAKNYLAQIVQARSISSKTIAYAKILFICGSSLQEYDNSLPALTSNVTEVGFDILSQIWEQQEKPIVVGKCLDTNCDILLDAENFNKNVLVCVDNCNTNQIILSNLQKQFDKSLVIDTLGISASHKYVAGVDFKLPLNTASLEFLYTDCLNDATNDSKSLIKEIFQELAEYSKTVPFVPFSALKNVIDDMVDKAHVFKLLVLKNKLAKFDKMGYFAQTTKEAQNITDILAQKSAVIDLSKLDTVFQNRYLRTIYSMLEDSLDNTQVFLQVSNSIDKKNLKKILTGNVPLTFMTHSRFKYLNEIKSRFKNFIIGPSNLLGNIFKSAAIFLNSMSQSSYMVVGEGTCNIPLISPSQELVITPKPNKTETLASVENQVKIEDLEEALVEEENIAENRVDLEENESSCSVNEEELHTSIEAIDKKSDNVIAQVTEEVMTTEIPTALNLFDDNEEEIVDNSVESNVIQEEQLEETVLDSEVINEQVNSSVEMLEETEEPVEGIKQNQALQENNQINELATVTDSSLDIANEFDEIEEDLNEVELINEQEEIESKLEEGQTIAITEDISDLTVEAEEIVVNETDDSAELSIPEEPEFKITENDNTDSLTENNAESAELFVEPSQEEFIKNTELEPNPGVEEDSDFDEIVELDISEVSDEDIVVDFTEDEVTLDSETLDKEIVEDVDKVFTTMKDDEISDTDLDFIDELNESADEGTEMVLSEGMEELPELQEEVLEEDILEPLDEVGDFSVNTDSKEDTEVLETRNSATPIVPVYEADIPTEDMVMSDPIEQGDTVIHAKYGNGIVEKMIKYGTKTLYSINFDNVGRRLLDPTLTEIKKA